MITRKVVDLDKLAQEYGDEQKLVYSIELSLLRTIAETSSDMLLARSWPEFREVAGGQKVLDEAHKIAVCAYERWLSGGVRE